MRVTRAKEREREGDDRVRVNFERKRETERIDNRGDESKRELIIKREKERERTTTIHRESVGRNRSCGDSLDRNTCVRLYVMC